MKPEFKEYIARYMSTALGILMFAGLLIFGASALLSPSVLAWTPPNQNIAEISSSTTEHWAWNDILGWVDTRNNNLVKVGDYSMEGYGASDMGDFVFDCETDPPGGTNCTSLYHVSNDRRGRLSGWAWNDVVGWISFCGETSNLLSDCFDLTANPYRVVIQTVDGKFSGYAWNDVVGWFSFDCGNHGGCGTVDYKTITAWRPTATTGTIESIVYDTSVQNGAQLNSIIWRGITPGQSSVDFSIAVSDNLVTDNLTQYDIVGRTSEWVRIVQSSPLIEEYRVLLTDADMSLLYNKRYIRYKAMLSDGAGLETPRIDEVILNWSP